MNVAQHLARAVERYGANVFAICDGRRATLASICDRATALANSLYGLGLVKGNRVVVLLENSIQCIEIDFGLARGGFVRVSLNPKISSHDAAYILEDSEPTLVIFGGSYAGLLSELARNYPTIKHWVRVDDGVPDSRMPGDIAYEVLLDRAQHHPVVDLDDEDDYCIFYTSGSSGKPKGVVLSHRSIVNVAYNVLIEFGPITQEDRVLLLQPLSHGSAFFVLAYALRGGCIVLTKVFDTKRVMQIIEDENISSMKLVPTMLHRLLEEYGADEGAFAKLKRVIYGGSHIAGVTLRRALAIFGARLYQHYGQSEAPSLITVLSGEDHVSYPADSVILTSAGRPITTVDVNIVGKGGSRVGANEVGEIVVRAPQVMTRYWRRPELTVGALRDGWLYTNDLGKIDERGYVYLLGRKDEMIISGGFNIAPKEVEDAISTHPGVREVVVIGKPDVKWGQMVVAYVSVVDSALGSEELISYVKPLLGFKSPKRVRIVPDLPKNTNGKLDRLAVCHIDA